MSPEQLRKRYGPHERRVRAVALLYWYFAALYVSAAAIGPAVLVKLGRTSEPERYGLDALFTVIVVTLTLAAVAVVTAWNLGHLNSAGRVLGAIGGCIALFGFPLGTLIGVFMLWTLLGKQGSVVFSQEYSDAVAATPQLQFRVSRAVIALITFFFLFMIGITLMAIAASL